MIGSRVIVSYLMKPISREPVLWRREPVPPGSSVPLLFVHGMWGWHWAWSNFVDLFSDAGYDCYAIDLYGHGPAWNNQERVNVSLEKYVAEVKAAVEFISERNTNAPPIIIGHSMGGLVVQKAVESLANQVGGMVLISSAAPRGIFALPPLRTLFILLRYLVRSLFMPEILPGVKALSYMVFHLVSGEELKMALERYVAEFSRAYRQLVTCSVPVDSSKITCPVLVIGAGRDRMVKPRTNRLLAQKYGAELRIFAENAHWLIREPGWPEPGETISAWIEKSMKPGE